MNRELQNHAKERCIITDPFTFHCIITTLSLLSRTTMSSFLSLLLGTTKTWMCRFAIGRHGRVGLPLDAYNVRAPKKETAYNS